MMCAAVGPLLLVDAQPAAGHALLASSEPADGEAVQRAPDEVVLTFTEEPEPALSEVRVFDASGQTYGQPLEVAPDDERTLRVDVGELPDGVYAVSWRVFSTVDGHVTGGSFAFGVGVSPEEIVAPTIDMPATPPTSPVEVAGRIAFYVGLALLVGGSLMAVVGFPASPTPLRRLAFGGVAAGGIGVALLAAAQVSASGAGIGPLLGTPIGRALAFRAAALGVGGVAVWIGRRWAVWGAVACGLAAAFVHVAAGHAATGAYLWAKVTVQWVHVSAAAIWVGGLAALLIGIRGSVDDVRTRAVRRYSQVAAFALLAVAGAGTFRAFNEISSWNQLLDTSYGRVVALKVFLLVVLVGLAAVNRYRSVPKANETLSPLRRVAKAELVVMAVVLALTGLLASLVPSKSVVSAEDVAALTAEATDFARTVEVRLEVTPGYPGPNEFAVDLRDPDTDAALSAQRVALRFDPSAALGVEGSVLDLEEGDEGRWQANGLNLSVGGVWTVVVLVERATTGVEVPITVATRCRTDSIPTPGQPTLHDVVLGSAGTVQGYLDPGEPGFNEVHFTFFDPDGNELTIDGPIAIGALPLSEEIDPDERLEGEVQRFSPGHYIGGVDLDPGRWRFDVTVEQASGERLTACFEEEIA